MVLLEAGDGVDGAAQDVGLGVAAHVSHGLLDFHDLRFALKAVEEEIPTESSGRRSPGATSGRWASSRSFCCSISLSSCTASRDRGSGGARSCSYFSAGGRPVDERGGQFLSQSHRTLGAHVAHAIAFYLLFRPDQLIGAVFEDEAAGEIPGESAGAAKSSSRAVESTAWRGKARAEVRGILGNIFLRIVFSVVVSWL